MLTPIIMVFDAYDLKAGKLYYCTKIECDQFHWHCTIDDGQKTTCYQLHSCEFYMPDDN